MENKQQLWESLTQTILSLGADRAAVISTSEVATDPIFRSLCEANSCGMYGRCWMCPPYVGEIGELMAQVGTYDYVLVYQQVSPLEDSFDVEGMQEARERLNRLVRELRKQEKSFPFSKSLLLGAGACGICPTCAKRQEKPCRFPELAMPSLEAYGINVSLLAKSAGMKYINGQNTVTYFGAVLFSIDGEQT